MSIACFRLLLSTAYAVVHIFKLYLKHMYSCLNPFVSTSALGFLCLDYLLCISFAGKRSFRLRVVFLSAQTLRWWAQVDSSLSPLTRPYTSYKLSLVLSPLATPLLVVGSSGLEPPTSRLSGARSNLLSYEPIWIEVTPAPWRRGGDDGIRTHDPLLAGQVLSQLSYTPSVSSPLSLPF